VKENEEKKIQISFGSKKPYPTGTLTLTLNGEWVKEENKDGGPTWVLSPSPLAGLDAVWDEG
jgi:hypothetical protein